MAQLIPIIYVRSTYENIVIHIINKKLDKSKTSARSSRLVVSK